MTDLSRLHIDAFAALDRAEHLRRDATGTYKEPLARIKLAMARAAYAEVMVLLTEQDSWETPPAALPKTCPCCEHTYVAYADWARLGWLPTADGTFEHRVCCCGTELCIPAKALDRFTRQTETTVPCFSR